MLADEQGQVLIQLARQTIKERLDLPVSNPVNEKALDDDALQEKRGVFVTLKKQGQLRGCIGNFTPNQPLIQAIRDMAAAATRDGRFVTDPITPAELDRIDIEISVLSPLVPTDDPLSLELGTHGIYIRRGAAAGCFLPQVAAETGWSKEEFLTNCCSHKAGLPGDAWKRSDTEVLLFTAEIFGEKELAEG